MCKNPKQYLEPWYRLCLFSNLSWYRWQHGKMSQFQGYHIVPYPFADLTRYIAWIRKVAGLVNGSTESPSPISKTAKLQPFRLQCYHVEYTKGPYLRAGVHTILSLSSFALPSCRTLWLRSSMVSSLLTAHFNTKAEKSRIHTHLVATRFATWFAITEHLLWQSPWYSGTSGASNLVTVDFCLVYPLDVLRGWVSTQHSLWLTLSTPTFYTAPQTFQWDGRAQHWCLKESCASVYCVQN